MSSIAGSAVGGRTAFQRFASSFGLVAAVLSVAGLLLAVGMTAVPALLDRGGSAPDSGPSYLTMKPAPPVRVSIGDTGAVAPIVASSLAPAASLTKPPADAPLVTWWDGSAKPGDAHGQTILTGHAQESNGALGPIASLGNGDFVDLLTKQGTMRYQVTSVRTLDPAKFAQASLDMYKQDGGAGRLTMISAEAWDGVDYQQMVVVIGKPLGEPN